jgi:hypothetical protein
VLCQAIEYVKVAVAEDEAGNYEKALQNYKAALEYFQAHLKYVHTANCMARPSCSHHCAAAQQL